MDAQALGRYLRETREAKELSLDQAEQALKIRRRILESFETGEFNLPEFAPIQLRGFIRNYARYLGLEEDRIVAYYEAALVEGSSPKRLSGRAGRTKKDKRDSQPLAPVAPRSVTDTPPSLPAVNLVQSSVERRRGPGPVTVAFRAIVAMAALAVIVYVAIQLLQPDNAPPPVPSGDILGNLPTPSTATPPPTEQQQIILPTSAAVLQPDFTGQGVLVTLKTTQRTWIHVSADGADQYEGIMRPGTSGEYPAGSNVTIIASNAEALDIVYNGQQQPTFGARGQMVQIVFSPTGVQITGGPGYEPTAQFSDTPAPTPTDIAGTLLAQLTPSDTPGPSPTPTDPPTDTLVPSDTPIPTDTPVPTETPVPTDTPAPSETPSSTPVPSDTLVPSNTPSPTVTPTFTLTPSPTVTPSFTPVPTNTPIPTDTPIPTATAILPPRVVPPGATPTKNGK